MTDNLPAILTTADLPAEPLAGAVASAGAYIEASVAANTQRAYRTQWKAFVSWCERHGVGDCPADPATVAAYLADLADSGRRASTIDSARAAIRKAHDVKGMDDPTTSPVVRQTLKGIRREIGTAPTQKAPVLTPDLRRMLSVLPDTLKGKRDRALLLLGFATGSRRSELVALTVHDIEETAEGLRIMLRRSKTDQEGKGMIKGVVRGAHPDTCPVSALREWLAAAEITDGPVFRRVLKGGHLGSPLTAQAVALVVKDAARAAKLDPTKYSGHSLRAGMVTQAAKNGVTVADIMRQTGHRSVETVNGYIRRANIFEDNASARLGL